MIFLRLQLHLAFSQLANTSILLQLTKLKGTVTLKDYDECECAADEKKPIIKLLSNQKDIRPFTIQAETDVDAKAWSQAINMCFKVCTNFYQHLLIE